MQYYWTGRTPFPSPARMLVLLPPTVDGGTAGVGRPADSIRLSALSFRALGRDVAFGIRRAQNSFLPQDRCCVFPNERRWL